MRFNHLLELLRLFPNETWSYYKLSQNDNITWDYVKKNPNHLWHYQYLSSNPTVTWDIVRANLDKSWNYYHLSKNPNITYDIIKFNPDIPWDVHPFRLIISGHWWEPIKYNSNLTWDVVYTNPSEFDFASLSCHDFKYAAKISWQYDNSTYQKYPDWIRKEIRLTLYILRNLEYQMPNDVKYEIIMRVADYLP